LKLLNKVIKHTETKIKLVELKCVEKGINSDTTIPTLQTLGVLEGDHDISEEYHKQRVIAMLTRQFERFILNLARELNEAANK
jgi:hypothetical protein